MRKLMETLAEVVSTVKKIWMPLVAILAVTVCALMVPKVPEGVAVAELVVLFVAAVFALMKLFTPRNPGLVVIALLIVAMFASSQAKAWEITYSDADELSLSDRQQINQAVQTEIAQLRTAGDANQPGVHYITVKLSNGKTITVKFTLVVWAFGTAVVCVAAYVGYRIIVNHFSSSSTATNLAKRNKQIKDLTDDQFTNADDPGKKTYSASYFEGFAGGDERCQDGVPFTITFTVPRGPGQVNMEASIPDYKKIIPLQDFLEGQGLSGDPSVTSFSEDKVPVSKSSTILRNNEGIYTVNVPGVTNVQVRIYQQQTKSSKELVFTGNFPVGAKVTFSDSVNLICSKQQMTYVIETGPSTGTNWPDGLTGDIQKPAQPLDTFGVPLLKLNSSLKAVETK